MKRFFMLILAVAMLTSLASCSPAPEPEFTVGTVEGRIYENPFIGIGCNLSDEWTYFTNEQIMQQNNVAAELAGEEYKQLMANATVFADMFASHSDQVSTVGVNIEKIDKVELAVLNIKSYLETAVPSIEQSLGNMGFVNITHSIESVKLDGRDVTCLNIISELGAFKMHQTIVAIKCNGYLACITFSGDSTESIDSALSNFYWLE